MPEVKANEYRFQSFDQKQINCISSLTDHCPYVLFFKMKFFNIEYTNVKDNNKSTTIENDQDPGTQNKSVKIHAKKTGTDTSLEWEDF
jgi:hypothetical protein